jgi:hypothetical protein
MTKVLDSDPLLARYIGSKALVHTADARLRRMRTPRYSTKEFTVETISRFDGRINAFWEEISPHFKILTRRDQRYLNWRYASHPERKYTIYAAVRDHRILGYCVLAQHQLEDLKLGLIVDVLGFQDHRNIVACLIDRAVGCFQHENVQGVTCMISEQHPYRSLLTKAGFIAHPRPNRALKVSINLRGAPADEKEVYSQALLLSQNPLLKVKRNWFMMYGDGDTA